VRGAGGVCAEDGQLHELDLLVCATSFRADAFMRPMGIVGVTLADAWAPARMPTDRR